MPMRAWLRALALWSALVRSACRLTWLNQAVKFDLFKAGVQPWGLPCAEPVRKAPVKFPQELLAGVTKQPVMYSGYVNVTNRDFLFYVFVKAHADPDGDAPLIVWTNGGPGCSSMEGMTTENGPLVMYGVKDNGETFSQRLVRNPYAWNRRAHLLYVDQPRYVGYSCGTGDFVHTSEEAGRDMVAFLRGWRELFPEHARRELILATESYGGHYVPAWASAIMDYNLDASDPFLISGIIIGNGIVNETTQSYSFMEFAKRQGLLPEDASGITTTMQAREAIARHLGYQPNFYDYRLREQECCGCSSYNYKPWADWLLRDDVTKALNVCGDAGRKAFGNCAAGCISLPEFDRDDSFDYSAALGRALDAGIRVTLYYGMQDTACNYVGGFAMSVTLPWKGQLDFAASPFEDLVVGSSVTGKVKSVGGLTWIQVDNAGHMTPINNPAAAAFALGTLLPDRPSARRLPKQRNQCKVRESDTGGASSKALEKLRQLYLRLSISEGSWHNADSNQLPELLVAVLACALPLSGLFMLQGTARRWRFDSLVTEEEGSSRRDLQRLE